MRASKFLFDNDIRMYEARRLCSFIRFSAPEVPMHPCRTRLHVALYGVRCADTTDKLPADDLRGCRFDILLDHSTSRQCRPGVECVAIRKRGLIRSKMRDGTGNLSPLQYHKNLAINRHPLQTSNTDPQLAEAYLFDCLFTGPNIQITMLKLRSQR